MLVRISNHNDDRLALKSPPFTHLTHKCWQRTREKKTTKNKIILARLWSGKKIRAEAAEASKHTNPYEMSDILRCTSYLVNIELRKWIKATTKKRKMSESKWIEWLEWICLRLSFVLNTDSDDNEDKQKTDGTTSRRRKWKRENLPFRIKLSEMCFILFICLLLAFSAIFWAKKKDFDWYSVYSNSNFVSDKTTDVAVKNIKRKNWLS